MKSLIGVDIGTGGVKAVLFDERGRCLAEACRPSELLHPAPGAVEEDPERQVTSVCRTIARCMKDSGMDAASVAGIGIDGQMAGVIGIGRDGRHVTPYDSWLDTRCGPYIKHMERLAGDEVVLKTGCPPSYNHGPKKLWWKHCRPRVYRRIARFVQPGSYAAMRLCGLGPDEAYIDPTYLHFSGLADNERKSWDPALCTRFGIDPAKLPRIVPCESIVGGLTLRAARRCGLRPDTPVIAGCGDTAASFLACGAVHEGMCVDVAGTASVFAATTRRFLPDVKQRVLACGRSAVRGLWHPYAYINGGGMNLDWFRRELAERGRVNGDTCASFEGLNALAGRVDRRSLPLFLPHMAGRVSPPRPAMRGAWVGLSWDHSLGHMFAAVMEAVALEYGAYRKALTALAPRLRLGELRVTGGGEASALWNRMKADVLGLPVRRIAGSHGAPMGVALLAGYGVGVFRTLSAAADRWVRPEGLIKPDRSLAAHYRRRLSIYERLLEKLDGALT